ncbi:MAG: hypothetical protein LBL04_08785 [Bacteroidales bacterium]|jgi:hypothetical protein|nr:hypothetical protein [Bacteroidales bacterium]
MKICFLFKKAGTVFVTVAIAVIASVLAGCQKEEVENPVMEKGTPTWDVVCEKMFAGEISAFTIHPDGTMEFTYSSKVPRLKSGRESPEEKARAKAKKNSTYLGSFANGTELQNAFAQLEKDNPDKDIYALVEPKFEDGHQCLHVWYKMYDK